MTKRVRSVVLPNQRQRIVEVLVGAGLVLSDFEWCDIESESGNSENALLIKHAGGDYYCKVDRGHGTTWDIEYCPASETDWTNNINEYWGNATKHIEKWAKRVTVELAAQDYVELAINNQQLLRLPEPEEEGIPLGDEERATFIERLEAVEIYLLALRSDSTEYQNQVQASLQFLKDHAKRSDRRSFYNLVFSTLLAIGLQFLTPTETKEVIQFATIQIDAQNTGSTRIVNNVFLQSK